MGGLPRPWSDVKTRVLKMGGVNIAVWQMGVNGECEEFSQLRPPPLVLEVCVELRMVWQLCPHHEPRTHPWEGEARGHQVPWRFPGLGGRHRGVQLSLGSTRVRR